MRILSLGRYPVFLATCGYVLAWTALNFFLTQGIQQETVRIEGPKGKPCLGTIWAPPAPKAVFLVGHGVTANQGVMAAAANTFARNGYLTVTIDFWGHGRSRERFDWSSNDAQVNRWCEWARNRFKDLPLVYLGHSMGGEAGDRAFRDKANVDAFISMGMLPQHPPACKTLIAMGRFEELFSVEKAQRLSQDRIDVVVSPFSDHTLEAHDPVLLQNIVAWTNKTLGFDSHNTFPWVRWCIQLLAAIIGAASAFSLAGQVVSLLRQNPQPCEMPPLAPPWKYNPFRIAGWVLRCKGTASPPRSSSFLSALIRGALYGGIAVTLLSWILARNIYTCSLIHPSRCVMWLILATIMTVLFLLTSRGLERVPLGGALQRFAVGAITRAVPLLLLGLTLELLGPGIAFAGMMLIILALVFTLIAAIYALATRSTGDYRSGAAACGIVLAWITAFWFPLVWV